MRTEPYSLGLYFMLVGKPNSKGAVRKIAREGLLDPEISLRETSNIVIRIMIFIKYEFSQS